MKTDNPFILLFEILSAFDELNKKTEAPHAPSFIFEYEDPIEISVYPGHRGICYKWENVWLLIAEGNKCCFLDKKTGELSDVVWTTEKYGRPECDKYLKRKPLFEKKEDKPENKTESMPEVEPTEKVNDDGIQGSFVNVGDEGIQGNLSKSVNVGDEGIQGQRTFEEEPLTADELTNAILPATITFEPEDFVTLDKVFIVSWFNLNVCLVVDRYTKETHIVNRGVDVKCDKDIFSVDTVSRLVSVLNEEKNKN